MGREQISERYVMHGTRLGAISLIDNHTRQCGSYLSPIGTRHAVIPASVCRNYEHRHRGVSGVVAAPSCKACADVAGAPRLVMMCTT
jgi:hypothetical protein